MAQTPLPQILIDLVQAGIDIDVTNNNIRSLPIKQPDMNTSNSESENDEAQQTSSSQAIAAANSTTVAEGERAVSPPPNCAICLGRCRKKCFTDSCMHQFCFKCLCEWSKVKPECPLCKQTFKSIIHNVKSMHQFEEYHVQPPTVQIHHAESAANILYGDMQFRLFEDEAVGSVPVRPRFVYPTYLGGIPGQTYTRSTVSIPPYVRGQSNHSPENLHMDPFSWRCVIYSAKLYAIPVSDITGRFRESSARFYRDNPAQIHRLIPFINRDVSVLLRNSNSSVARLVENINNALPLMNISSSSFRRRLFPYLGESTSHFIHELNNFARSPYDMIGYDRVVQYMSRDENNVGPQVAAVSAENATTNADADNNSNSLPAADYAAFSVSNTAEGAEVSGISMVNQLAAINLSTHNRAADVPPAQSVEPVEVIELDDEPEQVIDPTVHEVPDDEPPRHAEPTITDNIDLAVSSSSDCEFVLARKPPHLRTPEMVSLNSESDSDVVFVAEEQAPLPAPNTAQKTTDNNVQNTAKTINTRSRQSGYDGLFMGASTSTGITTTQRKRLTRRSARKRNSASITSGAEKQNAKKTRKSAVYNSSSDSDEDQTILQLKKRNNNKPKNKKPIKSTKNVQKQTTDTPNTRGRRKRRQTRSDRDSSTSLIKKSKTLDVNCNVSSEDDITSLQELKARLEVLKQTQAAQKSAHDEQDNGTEKNIDIQKNSQEQSTEEKPPIEQSIKDELFEEEDEEEKEVAVEEKEVGEEENKVEEEDEKQENDSEQVENQRQTKEEEEEIKVEHDIKFKLENNMENQNVAFSDFNTSDNSVDENSDSSNSDTSMTGGTLVLSRTPSGRGYSSSSTEAESSDSFRSEPSSPNWKAAKKQTKTQLENDDSSSGSSTSSSSSSSSCCSFSVDRLERLRETAIALQRELTEAGAIVIDPARVTMQSMSESDVRSSNSERGEGDCNQGSNANVDVEGDERFLLNGFDDFEQHNRQPSGE